MSATCLLLCTVLAQAGTIDAAPTPEAAAAPNRPRFRAAIEGLAETFPSGTPGGAQDLFAVFTPLLGFDGGEDFGLELGAALRLRLFDDPPAQRDQDFGGVLRRADWDEPSDFGQLLRELRIGRESSFLHLKAGAVLGYTLGHGHLVNRYSNQDNADYHPLGAQAHLTIGPTRTELLASDVLGARLFAVDVSVDMGRILSQSEKHFDRYHLALSLAHDFGRAGGIAPAAGAFHLDGDVGVYKGGAAQVFLVAGAGSRSQGTNADLGALFGLLVDAQPEGIELGGKVELRKQRGAFRQSLFGPTYELARFSAIGLANEPIALELLPDGFSGYAEFWFNSGRGDAETSSSSVSFSVAGEQFSFGRTDLDGQVGLSLMGGKATATARLAAVGLGTTPRYSFSAEARYRIFPALYVAAVGGTAFFPQLDGTLVRAPFAGLGVGVDFER